MFFTYINLVSAKIKYGMVVDAGSGGSRCHFFSWDSAANPPNVAPLTKPDGSAIYLELDDMKLASAAKDESMISKIFDPFIKLAVQSIPSSSISKARMFVYATAGMRLLGLAEQERIINKTYKYLHEKAPFKVKPHYVRVINGCEEGIFAWLSVNHLQGLFQSKTETQGAMDVGGASMQIALQITDLINDKPTNIVKVGSKSIPIFSHSYLGYGVNEASATIIRAIQAVSNNETILNPCFPKDYNGIVHGVNLTGTGNFEQCSSLIEKILLKHSAFSSILLPKLSDTHYWTGISTLYYINSYLSLSENSTLFELKNQLIDFCSTKYGSKPDKYSKNKYTHNYCMSGIFHYILLSKGFKFPEDKRIIRKLDRAGGAELSWAPGAMVYNVADIEIEDVPAISWTILIAGNLIGICIILPLYTVIVHNKRAPRYIPSSSL